MPLMKVFGLMFIFTFSVFADFVQLPAKYIVPLSEDMEQDETLVLLSHFSIQDPIIEQENKEITISFALPEMLIGLQLPIASFSGKTNGEEELILEGSLGTLICDSGVIKAGTSCFVEYNDEYQNLLELVDDLFEKPAFDLTLNPDLDQNLLEKHIVLKENFVGDPLGVLEFI